MRILMAFFVTLATLSSSANTGCGFLFTSDMTKELSALARKEAMKLYGNIVDGPTVTFAADTYHVSYWVDQGWGTNSRYDWYVKFVPESQGNLFWRKRGVDGEWKLFILNGKPK